MGVKAEFDSFDRFNSAFHFSITSLRYFLSGYALDHQSETFDMSFRV